MPTDSPHLFTVIPSLHRQTQLYTQRRSNAESPANYRFTIEEIAEFMASEFGVLIIHGQYASDADAAAAGCDIDQTYELTADNIYGLPEGILKRRKA